MKKNINVAELEAIFTEKVSEYIKQGYRFNTSSMGGSQGEVAKVDLRKDSNDEVVRVMIDSRYDSDIGKLITRIMAGEEIREIGNTRTIWNQDLKVLWEAKYIEVKEGEYEQI
jgi:hypothetical protein